MALKGEDTFTSSPCLQLAKKPWNLEQIGSIRPL